MLPLYNRLTCFKIVILSLVRNAGGADDEQVDGQLRRPNIGFLKVCRCCSIITEDISDFFSSPTIVRTVCPSVADAIDTY